MIVTFIVAAALAWADPQAASPSKTTELFDGRSLEGWSVTEFGGQGEVTVEDGQIFLEMGSDLTGITIAEGTKIPSTNYEVSLEAKRVTGSDFFCGLTFPVGSDFCSLIVGGWGGGLVGLSSLDGRDASDNETSSWRDFDNDRWYKIRIRVEKKRIQAWIDDKRIVNANIEDRKIHIRPEVNLSRPLGIATWRTAAAIKDIKLRPLTDEEIKQDSNEEEEE